MKKTLLWLACCFACIFSVHAQTLYGLTGEGGNDGVGSLIKFIPSTNNLTVSKSFENYTSGPVHTNFIQASDGKLYGMTSFGGNKYGTHGYGSGAIFSFDPSNSAYTKLKNFDGADGDSPSGSLIQANNGKLYGMTRYGGNSAGGGNYYSYGVIFSFDPVSSTYTKIIDFDSTNGANPFGSLLQASDGKLYGTTSAGGSKDSGVIFSYDLLSSTYTKLKDFGGAIGANPTGSLIEASDGKLYGTTGNGGSDSNGPGGVIFSFDPSTSVYTKLKDFGGADGASRPTGSLIQASNGKLYGMTAYGGSGNGVIFSFDPFSFTYAKLKDFLIAGSNHGTVGCLMQAGNGKLYGMTRGGGSYGYGVIFSFDPAFSTYAKLKDFDGINGAEPWGSLMQASNGKLYGMTHTGGIINGVIFSFDPSSSTYTKLKNFDAPDGRTPIGSLVHASNGKLYGVTGDGGSGAGGVIFSFDPLTSTFTKLKDFDYGGIDGSSPAGSLMQASNGKLYGMRTHSGVIFSFDPGSSTYTKLKDFASSNVDGANPSGNLMQASDGKLYGMTTIGGSSDDGGVIFSFDPTSSTYTKLKDFVRINGSFADGANPGGSLVQASNGKLYGVTNIGGSGHTPFYGGNGPGVIFSFDPSTSTYAKLIDFDSTNGAFPAGSLIQASDGKLYGITSAGGSTNNGVIFSFDPSTSIYTKLKDFSGAGGIKPYGSLMQANDGKLYGMTTSGGNNNNYGVIFSFDPSTSTYTKLKDFDGINGIPWYNNSAFIELESGGLPVSLLNFWGKNIGNSNQLTWKVENEQGLNNYELQRGIDGKNFTGVGQIKATGNNSYTYVDAVLARVSSTYYYRLKIIDKDGSFTYSQICTIRLNASNNSIRVSPNPATKSIRLETASGSLLTGNSSTATIRIYSSVMQLLQTKSISKADGGTIIIPVEKLASGIYYLQLVNGTASSVLKFVKE